jgi:hypothetical protein
VDLDLDGLVAELVGEGSARLGLGCTYQLLGGLPRDIA